MEVLKDRFERASDLWRQGYEAQAQGNVGTAMRFYQESLATYPTAEAHTFLGWAYSFLGRYEQAIEECKNAIAIDPDFGNPYNDIGSYLTQLGKADEAIPWLEQARLQNATSHAISRMLTSDASIGQREIYFRRCESLVRL